MAIVICTYKREQYVLRNIKKLQLYFAENPDIAKIYDIFVVDNGNTLSGDICTGNISLFPNKNTGGSGGFTRGIIEALESDKGYTHVILMDDDIEINTEGLFRTYTLSSLVNQKYSQSFISGSMLRSDIRDFQWEARAWMKGMILGIYARTSLSKMENLLKNEAIATRHTQYDYAGWWYCSVPLKAVGPDKLPFPFFIRGDDIDYSLKFADKVIHLNGICVWHEPFTSKVNNITDIYITVRNFLTTKIINHPRILYILYDLVEFFATKIFSYNYSGAFLVCRGIQDAISNKGVFEQDQIELFKQLESYKEQEQDIPVDLGKATKRTSFNWLQKAFVIVTYGGHVLPDFIFRKKNAAIIGHGLAISKCFMSKKVLSYNPQTGKTIVRKINRVKALRFGFYFLFLLLKLALCYPLIRRQLVKTESYYRTMDFWKKHLEMAP
jgi:GT2 family glycosyltransferase